MTLCNIGAYICLIQHPEVDFQRKPAPSIRIHPVFLAFSPPAAPALLHSDLTPTVQTSVYTEAKSGRSRRALAPALDGTEVGERLQPPYAVEHLPEKRRRGRTCGSCSTWSMLMRFKMAEAFFFFNFQLTEFSIVFPASDGR